MTDINRYILCDVRCCSHNYNGCNCTLTKIKVTSDNPESTCCGSFDCTND